MVISALEKFNSDNKTQYSLHVICGVNNLVSGPMNVPWKYEHCHINFLATCLDEQLHDQPTNLYFADQPTKLFFAECSQLADDDCWCAPVDCWPDAGQTRCFYCEKQGSKIIHPAWPYFHGSDFKDAFFGSLSTLYRNDRLIGKAYRLDWVNSLEEDVIYGKSDDGDAGNGLKPLEGGGLFEPLEGGGAFGPF